MPPSQSHWHDAQEVRSFPALYKSSKEVPSHPFSILCAMIKASSQAHENVEWVDVPIASRYAGSKEATVNFYRIRAVDGESFLFINSGMLTTNVAENPECAIAFYFSSLGVSLNFRGIMQEETDQTIRQKIWNLTDSHTRAIFSIPFDANTSKPSKNPDTLDERMTQELAEIHDKLYAADGTPTPQGFPTPPSTFHVLRFTPNHAKFFLINSADSLPIAVDFTKTNNSWTKRVLIPGI